MGISAHAFDVASADYAAVSAPPVARPLRALALDALCRNAIAATGFLVLLEVETLATRWLGDEPMVHRLGLLLAMLCGIRLAHRVGGRLVRVGLVAIGAGQAVLFVFLLASVTFAELHVLNLSTPFTGILATLGVCLSRRDGGAPSTGQRAWSRVRAVARRVLPGQGPVGHELVAALRVACTAARRPV